MSATIQAVRATWTTAFSDDLWGDLRRAGTDGFEDQNPTVLKIGPTLADSEDARVAYLTVRAPRPAGEAGASPGAIHWMLLLSKAPSSAPPPEVTERSARLGGRAGLMARLERWLPGVPPVVTFQTSLRLPKVEFRSPLLPKKVFPDGLHDAAASLAPSAFLEQIGYRFENSPYGLEELAIIYGHQRDLFLVDIRSTSALRIGTTTWLPHAGEIAEVAIKAFFVREGAGT